MAKKSVRDLEVAGRRVLIRADLNVPLDAQRRVSDDRRIRQFLPTLRNVLSRGGRAVIMSHLGRPSGDANRDRAFSLDTVTTRLAELYGRPCTLAPGCAGPAVEATVQRLNDGDMLLLENLRFQAAETIIDKADSSPDGRLTPQQEAQREEFSRALAGLGEAYVNDAFGTCHRRHVSMYDVPRRLPRGTRAMGLLVETELRYLGEALERPRRPFVAILGGAKVSDKIELIRRLLERVDRILIGGAMTYTFWAAQGLSVGKSLCERDKLALARELLAQAGPRLQLPTDSVVGPELRVGVETRVVEGALPPDALGLDIGPATVQAFTQAIRAAGTILWNGPLGAFETPPFDRGTMEIARQVAVATDAGALSIIGGGDSAAAVEQAGVAERMSHVSTGGGAALTFLEGRAFEAIEVLDESGT
jgi:phosphoglycerate kinase